MRFLSMSGTISLCSIIVIWVALPPRVGDPLASWSTMTIDNDMAGFECEAVLSKVD